MGKWTFWVGALGGIIIFLLVFGLLYFHNINLTAFQSALLGFGCGIIGQMIAMWINRWLDKLFNN